MGTILSDGYRHENRRTEPQYLLLIFLEELKKEKMQKYCRNQESYGYGYLPFLVSAKMKMNKKDYRGVIGELMYIVKYSRFLQKGIYDIIIEMIEPLKNK